MSLTPAYALLLVELKQLEKFVAEVDTRLSEGARQLEHKSPEDKPGQLDRIFELDGHFRLVLYEAAFLAAFSHLDFYLAESASTSQKVLGQGLDLSDVRGGGVQRAADYFRKGLGVSLTTNSELWTTVLRLSELRNSFVHNGRLVPDDQKALSEWIDAHPQILHRINKGRVIVHKEFIPFVLLRLLEFSEHVESAVRDRLRKAVPTDL